MRLIIYTILSLYLSHITYAATDYCSPVRLDKLPKPAPMLHVPVVNQRLGTCYAHTAAQLIDAYRFSHKPPKGDRNYSHHSFSLDLAVKSKTRWWYQFIEKWFYKKKYRDAPDGGLVCPTIRESVKSGRTCSKEHMLKEIDSLFIYGTDAPDQVKSFNMRDYLARIDDLYQCKQNQTDQVAPCNLTPFITENIKQLKNLVEIANSIREKPKNRLTFIKQIIEKQCRGHWQKINSDIYCASGNNLRSEFAGKCKQDILNIHRNCDDTPSDLELLHKYLPKQPVAISYCANFLTEGKKATGHNFLGIRTKKCFGHASLIIGRKRVGKKCMLLLRNSWGTSCNPYSDDFKCEHGNIWVDEDTLKKSLDSIQIIRDN